MPFEMIGLESFLNCHVLRGCLYFEQFSEFMLHVLVILEA